MNNLNEWWLIYATILSYISYQDIRYRIISNNSCLIVLIISCSNMVIEQNFDAIQWSFLILGVGFVLNLFNVCGAGDVKLLSSLSLAINPAYISAVLIIIALLGGITVFILLILSITSVNSKMVLARGVPYGVPICIGSLIGIYIS